MNWLKIILIRFQIIEATDDQLNGRSMMTLKKISFHWYFGDSQLTLLDQ